MNIASKFGDNRLEGSGVSGGSIWEKLRNKSDYAKTGGPIKMILGGVADIVNASLVLEFVDNWPREGERVGVR